MAFEPTRRAPLCGSSVALRSLDVESPRRRSRVLPTSRTTALRPGFTSLKVSNALRKTAGSEGLKVKEVINLLEEDGWSQVRQRGSHRQFKHQTKRGTVTVSGKPNIDLPPATLNSILKQVGLKE